MPPPIDPWTWLAPMLARLDRLLAPAVVAASRRFGEAAASDPYRGLHVTQDEAERLLATAPGTPLLADGEASPSDAAVSAVAPLAALGEACGLDAFDLDVLILALAPELDLRYERLYGYLQDDVTRRRPTVALALDLLCRNPAERLARRRRFLPEAPLLRHALLDLPADPAQAGAPLLARPLRLEAQMLRRLLGDGGFDPALAAHCARLSPKASPAGADPRLATLLALAAPARAAGAPLLLHFHGPTGTGRRRTALALADGLGAPLLVLDIPRVLAAEAGFERSLAVLLREARLDRALVCAEGFDAIEAPARMRERTALLEGARALGLTVILTGPEPPGRTAAEAVAVSFALAPATGRAAQWRAALAAAGLAADPPAVEALAAGFRLSGRQIAQALAGARAAARWRAAGEGTAPEPDTADLFAAARAQSGQDLAALARRVGLRQGRADLVLPEEAMARLDDFCARARLRPLVHERWGFERKLATGRGLTALFAGPSGTGKTMAAAVVAGELGLDLYRIDLSQVVSKYIGETEKNLDRVFAAAESANAVLFFDEADALFGRRSEVKDAHDRFANIEIGYLLQKMDEYEGIAVLATNLRQNMDEAFIRRLQVVVEFPFPGEAERRRIWAGAFPPEAPLAPDVDFDWLAREVRLSGGKIRNIALGAAFGAARLGVPIGMGLLREAARREYEKAGQVWGAAERG